MSYIDVVADDIELNKLNLLSLYFYTYTLKRKSEQ